MLRDREDDICFPSDIYTRGGNSGIENFCIGESGSMREGT